MHIKQLRYLMLQPTEQGGHETLLMVQLLGSIWGSTQDFTPGPPIAWATTHIQTSKDRFYGCLLFS